MKKLILSFILFAIALNLSAQYNQEELLKEMQKMQEEMMKNFQNLEFNFGDSQMLIDTFFIKEFDSFGDEMPLEFHSGDLSEMMDLLQKQMQQMDSEDWSEIEKLFKSFGDFSPTIPAPENSEEFKEDDIDIKDNSNKKRKTYQL